MKSFRKRSWRIADFFYRLLEGDVEWAERRLSLVLIAIFIFTLMGRATEQIEPWQPLLPFFSSMPEPVADLIHFVLSLLYPQTLRHLLPPLVGGLLAFFLAANYVRDLFELPDINTGARYLAASMFGMDYPSINIKGGGYEVSELSLEGRGQIEKGETNPIPKIGGPGYVGVQPGNAALFEHVGAPSKVTGAGTHFIRRFESLREVVDLRDQFRTREEVKALTKDGILVTVRNVQVSFRVRTSSRPRSPEDIYPFSVSAIKRIAYGKTVGARGASIWTDSVPGAVTGMIRNHISRTLLDDLITRPAESETDPREKIKSSFDSKDSRRRFADMGVELLWVSLGHIETPQDVLDQRIRTWQADWRRQDQVTMAEGEAHKLRVLEYARALARLEFIETATRDMPLELDDTPDDDFIVVQFAEALNSTGRQRLISQPAQSTGDPLRVLQQLGLLTSGAQNKPNDNAS